MEDHFDLIVVGAGSGGLASAKRAARHGAKVAVIEGDRVGGTCVIRGCVPKKLMVYASLYKDYLDAASCYGVQLGEVEFDSCVLLENVRKEVNRLNELHIELLKKAGVTLFKGWGKLVSNKSVKIFSKNNIQQQIYGEHILIAVGGKAFLPRIEGSNLSLISDDIFCLKRFPRNIVIVGGGFIACEFSSIMNSLGTNVTQLVRSDNLLRGFDKEITTALIDEFNRKGINIVFSTNVEKVKENLGKLIVETTDNNYYETDQVLFATGRKPSINSLGLEDVGLEVINDAINVDKFNNTNISNIYAIGDVTNRVNLTPVAIDEGRALSDRLFTGKTRYINYELIPKAVFTNPEIASIGLTEEEAFKVYGQNKINIYRSKFRSMSKSLQKKGAKCILKLVVDAKSEEILGCHMFGENASEIIQMASIAIGMKARKSDFDLTMALHPTIAEEFVTMG